MLVRFADDLVVMCWSRSQAEAALERLRVVLADLGPEPKAAKTRIVHLEERGRGRRFPQLPAPAGALAWLNRKSRVTFLARRPAASGGKS